jgi:hypothetical protein
LRDQPQTQVTELLALWRSGDSSALESLLPLVYNELRRLAHSYVRQERPNHTLQTTALVHEAYLRLNGQKLPDWKDRAHFFGIAARLMRQILVEYARARGTAKRGGNVIKLASDDVPEQFRDAATFVYISLWGKYEPEPMARTGIAPGILGRKFDRNPIPGAAIGLLLALIVGVYKLRQKPTCVCGRSRGQNAESTRSHRRTRKETLA